MNDYISRQAAIKTIKALHLRTSTGTSPSIQIWLEAKQAICNCIEQIKPADVRPVVRGRWVRINEHDKESNVKCSFCNKEFSYIDGICYLVSGSELPPSCPNCGADMREEI